MSAETVTLYGIDFHYDLAPAEIKTAQGVKRKDGYKLTNTSRAFEFRTLLPEAQASLTAEAALEKARVNLLGRIDYFKQEIADAEQRIAQLSQIKLP